MAEKHRFPLVLITHLSSSSPSIYRWPMKYFANKTSPNMLLCRFRKNKSFFCLLLCNWKRLFQRETINYIRWHIYCVLLQAQCWPSLSTGRLEVTVHQSRLAQLVHISDVQNAFRIGLQPRRHTHRVDKKKLSINGCNFGYSGQPHCGSAFLNHYKTSPNHPQKFPKSCIWDIFL